MQKVGEELQLGPEVEKHYLPNQANNWSDEKHKRLICRESRWILKTVKNYLWSRDKELGRSVRQDDKIEMGIRIMT
eukprot:g51756.t1